MEVDITGLSRSDVISELYKNAATIECGEPQKKIQIYDKYKRELESDSSNNKRFFVGEQSLGDGPRFIPVIFNNGKANLDDFATMYGKDAADGAVISIDLLKRMASLKFAEKINNSDNSTSPGHSPRKRSGSFVGQKEWREGILVQGKFPSDGAMKPCVLAFNGEKGTTMPPRSHSDGSLAGRKSPSPPATPKAKP
jgi:hypothetical protein